MKKYFKIGIAIIIPVALVVQVLMLLYNFFNNLLLKIFPQNITYHWYYVFIFIVALVIIIFMIGLIFSFLKPVKWIKDKIDKHIINKIPLVNSVYNFGKDIGDSLLHDIQKDDWQVVELRFAGQLSLGALTDSKNNIIFVPTAPNPLNGFILKTSDYEITDMKFSDLIKLLGSLGKVNGKKWKERIKK